MRVLTYLALPALLTAGTLNGLSFDWALLGASVTIHPDQIILVVLLPLLAALLVTGQVRVRLAMMDWLVLAYIFVNFVASAWFAPSRGASLQAAVLLAAYAAMYLVARLLIGGRRDRLTTAANWLLGLGVAQAIYSLLALLMYSRGLFLRGIQESHLTRGSIAVEGTLWEANLLGAFSAVVAVFFAVRYIGKRDDTIGWAYLAGLFLTALVIPVTMTRAAGLAFGMALLIVIAASWFFLRSAGLWVRRVAAVAVVVASVTVVTVTVMNDLVSSISRSPNVLVARWLPASWIPAAAETPVPEGFRPDADPDSGQRPKATLKTDATRATEDITVIASRSSVEGRLEAWRLALKLWRERPILGHGTLGGRGDIREGWWFSSLVQALHDTGLAGLFTLSWIYVAAVFLPVRSWFRHGRGPLGPNLLALAAGNGVLFVTSQFSSFLFAGFPWIFLGVTMGAVDAAPEWRQAPAGGVEE